MQKEDRRTDSGLLPADRPLFFNNYIALHHTTLLFHIQKSPFVTASTDIAKSSSQDFCIQNTMNPVFTNQHSCRKGNCPLSDRSLTQTDLSDPALYDAGIPHQVFAEIRKQPGLSWNPLQGEDGFWAVTRFEDIVEVSRHPETFSSATGHIQIYTVPDDCLEARASMIDMDPPNHSRLRRLVNPGFIPKNLRLFEPIVRQRASALLDDLVAEGGGDWVEKIAKPIPISIICDMLGVPEEDRNYMIELTDHLVAGTANKPLDPNAYGNTTPLRFLPFESPAAFALDNYARDLGNKRRAEPQDDLVTKLINAEVDGEKLTEAEFTNFFRLLIFAGNETTRSAMSNLVIQMVNNPEIFASIKDNPDLIDGAVEEIVRVASPILYFRRTATCDTVLSGTPVKKGEKVVMWYASGNFDEARFAAPLDYDVTRPKMPHIGYGGGGVHTCLGAGLARIELRILLEEILKRDMKISLAEPPEYVHSNFVNGIEKLVVRLG
ncbi:cytochrome P450 [Rhodobacteraceae bacterium CY05]|uniref:Cytochrome P450 n=1 Tax=Parasedimentitalea huanghaiensis TaxID=2682100 RepID=A0A6L6WKK9_9RHOB|nr:cytochrome P450 [Zongyanglinia huanghaiensis]